MSGSFGKNINISIFGESHGEGIGIVLNGIKAGFKVDIEKVFEEMERRAPGRNTMSTARKEADEPIILSGIFEGYTTGTPIAMMIKNSDVRSKDYSKTKDVARPSHADFTGYVKYNGFNDYRGGGHFSGRITAPLVFAGAIAKQILEEKGIFVGSHIKQIGSVCDDYFNNVSIEKEILEGLKKEVLPVLNQSVKTAMEDEISKYKNLGDSVGGTVEVCVIGLKAGVGNPFFDSIESIISHLVFSVPAVKGIEFGLGFGFASTNGISANDEFYVIDDKIVTPKSNNNGGINGGISNGMPIIYRAVIKPTPSISITQKTVNFRENKEVELDIVGRHDPCIVQRALVVLEAVTAIGILELLGEWGEQMISLDESRKKIDEIDTQLMKLFEERMNVVVDVAQFKKENKLEIFQAEREKEVIQKNIDRVSDNLKPYAKVFLEDLMKVSREYQKEQIGER